MADYKGVIKFIGADGSWALVHEKSLIENQSVTDSQIGTGTGSKTNFTADLTPVVEEGELSFKVDGSAIDASDSSGVITGNDITTSTGKTSTISYKTGALSIHFKPASTPALGKAVTISYQYSEIPSLFDGHRLVKGDFSRRSVGDSIYYDYDGYSDFNDGHDVTETYES